MAEELSIISSSMLTDVSETEINSLIEKIVASSKNNMDEICELTLECTPLLASAESRSTELSDQGIFKRLIGNFTGKNQKLRDSILKDQTNALYAAQGVINRVMAECNNNRKLMLAVNDRISDVYLELKENQNEVAAGVLMIRKAIVAFYKQYKEKLLEQEIRISKVEQFARERCPKCQKEILSWQRICPYCGEIHSLKTDNMSEETRKILGELSKIINSEDDFEDIAWSVVARKKARVMRKVKLMAEIGKIPGFTDELVKDIDSLINKCKSEEFQIAIVGVMKAGKSFLMNALMGEEIASVEVNPETAALTKFRSTTGYYVKIRFQTEKEWSKLKNSALKSKNIGKDSLRYMIEQPEIAGLEKKWVNHKDLYITCSNVAELRRNVKKYTSSRDYDHLFVAEVEVGVDASIFNMPKEVVFVDTPGLKDPVKYRSDITRAYIKKADAVLIAVPTAALTAEGNEIITTVLDCTDTKKAYIVATQKDLKDTEEDCEKVVSLWVKKLVGARRYENNRSARSRIILTSAKMDLLLDKWVSLGEDQRNNPDAFSDNDYSALESFVKRILKNRRYKIEELPYDQGNVAKVKQNAGIELLRKKLEDTLITKHRELKIAGIESDFVRCKERIKEISQSAVNKQLQAISLAESGAEELKRQLDETLAEKQKMESANQEIRNAAEQLEKEIMCVITDLERKGR